MIIRWQRRAERDLDAIFDYLLDRNPQAARQTFMQIHERVSLLADHPGLGRAGRVPDTRELVITGTPYLVAYTADARAEAVIILRVLHGAQQYPADNG